MLNKENLLKLHHLNYEIRFKLKPSHNALNCPQPGYFCGDILFIFQNPGIPRMSKPQDKILLDRNSSMEEVEDAYKSTLQKAIMGNFIEMLDLDWDDISITNIVKFPTTNNETPHPKLIEDHLPYVLEQIKFLHPQLIILVGAIAKKNLYNKLKDKYKVLCFIHYSYLMRKNILREKVEEYKREIYNKLKWENQGLDRYIG